MSTIFRRCLAMSVGVLLLGGVLLASGVPGAVLLVTLPALLCAGLHLVMSHGDPDGAELLETARRAAQTRRE
jgi:hypothetical protein